MSGPRDRLRHHVTGAIERGEKVAVVEQRAVEKWGDLTIRQLPSWNSEARACVTIGCDTYTAHGATFAEAANNLREHLDNIQDGEG